MCFQSIMAKFRLYLQCFCEAGIANPRIICSSTLDNSFKVLFGRFKEQQENIDATSNGEVVLPRTLDDARRLVEPKSINEDEDPVSGASSVAEHQLDGPLENNVKPLTSRSEDKLLGLISGRKESRDRSADSAQSSGSGKRVAFAANSGPGNAASQSVNTKMQHITESPATSSPIESMRNLGNSLNPLKGFSGMGGLRFGRGASSTSNSTIPSTEVVDKPPSKPQGQSNLEKEKTPSALIASKTKIEPPIQRFLVLTDVNKMRIGEVEELLKDYKRLADKLQDLEAF